MVVKGAWEDMQNKYIHTKGLLLVKQNLPEDKQTKSS